MFAFKRLARGFSRYFSTVKKRVFSRNEPLVFFIAVLYLIASCVEVAFLVRRYIPLFFCVGTAHKKESVRGSYQTDLMLDISLWVAKPVLDHSPQATRPQQPEEESHYFNRLRSLFPPTQCIHVFAAL